MKGISKWLVVIRLAAVALAGLLAGLTAVLEDHQLPAPVARIRAVVAAHLAAP